MGMHHFLMHEFLKNVLYDYKVGIKCKSRKVWPCKILAKLESEPFGCVLILAKYVNHTSRSKTACSIVATVAKSFSTETIINHNKHKWTLKSSMRNVTLPGCQIHGLTSAAVDCWTMEKILAAVWFWLFGNSLKIARKKQEIFLVYSREWRLPGRRIRGRQITRLTNGVKETLGMTAVNVIEVGRDQHKQRHLTHVTTAT